jgi:rubrerythrin
MTMRSDKTELCSLRMEPGRRWPKKATPTVYEKVASFGRVGILGRMPEGCQIRESYPYFLKECHFLSYTPAGHLQGHAGHFRGGAVFNAGCRYAWRATLAQYADRRTGEAATSRTYKPTVAERLKRPPLCEECGIINRSDPPSKLCPGCQAYAEHQR